MKNLGQMMKQAQQMQTRMSEMQEEMEAHEVEGVSGGGLVVVRVNGKFDVRGVSIDPAMRISLSVVLFLVSALLGVYLYRRCRRGRSAGEEIDRALEQ